MFYVSSSPEVVYLTSAVILLTVGMPLRPSIDFLIFFSDIA
jgi:hypothetical protein